MPATDRFNQHSTSLSSPFSGGEPVTPSDSEELTNVTRALWVGQAGNLSVITAAGSELSFANFGPGWLPGRIRQVRATGTTAANMVGVW